MSQKLLYPNASALIDPGEHIIYNMRHGQGLEDAGRMWIKLAEDLLAGRFDEVRGLSFVERVATGGVRGRESIPPSVRNRIRACPCAACGATDRIEVDHIIPVSKGGHGRESNLQPLCRPCNQSKGTKAMGEWMA